MTDCPCHGEQVTNWPPLILIQHGMQRAAAYHWWRTPNTRLNDMAPADVWLNSEHGAGHARVTHEVQWMTARMGTPLEEQEDAKYRAEHTRRGLPDPGPAIIESTR